MGLAAGLCGMGQGRATGSATEALARNPGARASIQLLLVLGLAFIESLSLFTFVIILLKAKSAFEFCKEKASGSPEAFVYCEECRGHRCAVSGMAATLLLLLTAG